MPGISSSGQERIYSHIDGEMSFTTWFNKAAGQEHLILRGKSSGADRVACWFHGSGVGNVAAGLVSKQINYDPNRAQDGSLSSTTQCLGVGHGLEYCEQLTAGKRTDASAANGDSFDAGASSALGLAAYIQVFSLGSGSPTVKIQESSDDDDADDWADVTGGTFGVVAANTAARIVTALDQAVEQYLRVVTTGTFTNLVFAVCYTRFPYA